MTLLNYQTEIQIGRLYKLLATNVPGNPQLRPNIAVDSGSVDVYSSNSATQPASLSDLSIAGDDDEDVSGIQEIYIIPRYMVIVQNQGTSTEVILSQCQAEDLGAIS